MELHPNSERKGFYSDTLDGTRDKEEKNADTIATDKSELKKQ